MRGESMPTTMAARPWLLLLCLAGVLQGRAQPDTTGFVSIDCGLPVTAASYIDNTTGLHYVSDDGFVDDGAGTNNNISAAYLTPDPPQKFLNLRSFPDGVRNCYTFRALEAGRKYLIRATFMYGNYDNLDRPPIFDLYLGVNFWAMVNITRGPGYRQYFEVITVVPDDFAQVCLVNTGAGTPYISALELRPVKSSLYPGANATQGLFLLIRTNFGGDAVIRYPDDPLDRQWHPWVFNDTNTIAITTNMHMMRYVDNDMFEAPSTVMQTAVTPAIRKNMAVYWDWSFVHLMLKDPSPSYMSTLYISELQLLPRNAVRQFDIFWDDDIDQAYLAKAYSPEYLFSEPIYSIQPFHINQGDNTYTISLRATANSTLPPIINAFEAFAVISTTELETDSQDVSAIMAIKDMYKVHKNWMGDPCAPKTFVWDGLTCIYVASSPPRITKVNMSFVGLSGVISSSFANLTAVQYMDLSHNNLSGTIPDSLSQLSSLQILDLTGNHLSGPTPPGILKRIQDGTLVLKYENNPELSTNVDSRRMSQRKSKLAMYIAIPVVLVVVIVSLVATTSHILRRQNRVSNGAHVQGSLQHENLRFTYKQLQIMTENFRQVLGQGGFGTVYYGQWGSKQVAVKLRSDDSRQGPKEFLAEARILTRIHHRNLVSLIGYCKDRGHMALVYEHMPKGTLKDHISRSAHNGILFTWRQRLKIVVESAQGLEYLHKSCSPPLIHLDIKPANILLSDILEAKIADFGLSKVFNSENEVHISTGGHPAGTVGYMDPEYLETGQPTVKSDVYSFGVVMLELITGRPAIMSSGVNIITWVQQRKERGNIECLVDPCMRGEHDVNSVYKAVETALKCTTRASTQRPTMTNVVAQLQECLKLEDARASIFYSCNSNDP